MIKDFYNRTEEELAKAVELKVSPRRFQHILGVVEYAEKLAKQNGVDVDQAKVAAYVHDYAKEFSDEVFLAIIDEMNMNPELKKWGNPIWHGVLGAQIVNRELNIQDMEILAAVSQHTTGDVMMSKLSQVLFMSDFLEAGREFEGVEKIRNITNDSLEEGVKSQLSYSIASLVQRQRAIYPRTIAAYNKWVGDINE